MNKQLDKFKDRMSQEIFGTSKSESLRHGLCIQCQEEALSKCYSDAGRKEYRISGLCEECFDAMFKEEGL